MYKKGLALTMTIMLRASPSDILRVRGRGGMAPTEPYTRSRAITLHTDLSHIELPSICGFGMSGAISLGCMRHRLLMWMITPRKPSEIGAPPRFLLTASLGEVEGKRTEKNIKMTGIMHIGFYRSRATPGQRTLVNSHFGILHKTKPPNLILRIYALTTPAQSAVAS